MNDHASDVAVGILWVLTLTAAVAFSYWAGELIGWERAMQGRGCGIASRTYEALPFGFRNEDERARGWICPGDSQIHYIDDWRTP